MPTNAIYGTALTILFIAILLYWTTLAWKHHFEERRKQGEKVKPENKLK